MVTPSPSVQVYPVVKVSMIVGLLAEKGIGVERALADTGISPDALHSPQARVSITQVIACYRNAMRLSRDPQFAYNAGLRFHLSTYGLYGFAMLSSPDFRDTLQFAVRYHRLATPLSEISTGEEADRAWWDVVPLAHPLVDVDLYRFMVELHFGTLTTLQRDFMGASFSPNQVQVTYGSAANTADYPAMFGCPVCFGQPRNLFLFDSAWLDRPAILGNPVVFPEIVALCDALVKELDGREGMAGKVRRALLARSCCSVSFEDIVGDLSLSPRTLRRRLREENTSFRKLLDELRAEMAIKYIRETDLSMDEIAAALGFSEPAAFRHAFRRWTKAAPSRFRELGSSLSPPQA
jgi:AraC-like DNA-binding protein